MIAEQKRDLAADLQICEAATPVQDWYTSVIQTNFRAGSTDEPYSAFMAAGPMHQFPRRRGRKPGEQEIAAKEKVERDRLFFREAREGWPHAIRRAMRAEAETERLLRLIEQLETLLSVINGLANDGLSTSGVERRSLGRIRDHARGALDCIHVFWHKEDRRAEEEKQ